MKTTEEMIAVMQSHADGEAIQRRSLKGGWWTSVSLDSSAWDWCYFDFRIKPAESKKVMMQMWQRIDGTLFAEEISKSFGTRNKNKPKQPYKKVGEPFEFVYPEGDDG